MSLSPPKHRLKPYKNNEWNERKAFIIRLYTKEHQSVEELVKNLAATGFYVNKRMIMTRVMQWGIGRHLREKEMCAAMLLIAEHELNDLSTATTFTVRGQPIHLGEILRYFRRKKIADPVAYAKGHEERDSFEQQDVSLRKLTFKSTSTPLQQLSSDQASMASNAGGYSRDTSEDETCQSLYQHVGPLPRVHVSMTTAYPVEDRMLWAISTYVMSYKDSPRQYNDQEPQVHHLTTHGRFGSYMQEGISLMNSKKFDDAFARFNRGYEMVPLLLREDHPMGLALMLTILCELKSKELHPLATNLTQFTCKMQREKGRGNHPVDVLFSAMDELKGPSMGHLLRVMRKAVNDIASAHGRTDWRALYIKERFCDALYYADESTERMSLRCELLQDQIQRYGPCARNVLWTKSLVADDLMLDSNFDQACVMFEDVIACANNLEGYGKAKTRFAAMEGLGTAQLQLARNSGASTIGKAHLNAALQNFERAEAEALLWFETSSRRVERVRASKRAALELDLTYQV